MKNHFVYFTPINGPIVNRPILLLIQRNWVKFRPIENIDYFRHVKTELDTQKMSNFSELGLDDCVVKWCSATGLTKPTPIQHHCIQPILQGDLLIRGCGVPF